MTTHLFRISAAGLSSVTKRLRRRQSTSGAGRRPHSRALCETVSRVDDPDGQVRILAVRGLVGDVGVGELIRHVADIAPGQQVHFELTDAIISGRATMRRLGVLADRLEARGVVVRVVGVDPDHPALPRCR